MLRVRISRALWHTDCLSRSLDINMPGMNGYDLGRRLREQATERPPILAAVTGYSDEVHLDRAADAGFDLHFTKPADPDDVVQQLDDCLCR